MPQDVEGASQNDWGKCVFARACRRLYGSQRVAFFRSVAYVELLDETGKPTIERFQMPRVMRQQIERFDKTKKAPPGGFLLLPPRPSYTLDAKHIKSAKERKAKKAARAAAIVGHGDSVKITPRKPLPIKLDWRSGTGMVHFCSDNGILQKQHQ